MTIMFRVCFLSCYILPKFLSKLCLERFSLSRAKLVLAISIFRDSD